MSKVGAHCRIGVYVKQQAPKFHELLDDSCQLYHFKPRGGEGVTLLMPDKKRQDSLNKLALNGEIDKLDQEMRNLVITEKYSSLADFEGGFTTKSGTHVSVSSVSAKEVKLSNGDTITSAPDFKPSRDNMMVFNLHGDQPLTGSNDEEAPKKTKKKGGATDNAKQLVVEKVARIYKNPDGNKHIYCAAVWLLLKLIERNCPEMLRNGELLNNLGLTVLDTFYLLLLNCATGDCCNKLYEGLGGAGPVPADLARKGHGEYKRERARIIAACSGGWSGSVSVADQQNLVNNIHSVAEVRNKAKNLYLRHNGEARLARDFFIIHTLEALRHIVGELRENMHEKVHDLESFELYTLAAKVCEPSYYLSIKIDPCFELVFFLLLKSNILTWVPSEQRNDHAYASVPRMPPLKEKSLLNLYALADKLEQAFVGGGVVAGGNQVLADYLRDE